MMAHCSHCMSVNRYWMAPAGIYYRVERHSKRDESDGAFANSYKFVHGWAHKAIWATGELKYSLPFSKQGKVGANGDIPRILSA